MSSCFYWLLLPYLGVKSPLPLCCCQLSGSVPLQKTRTIFSHYERPLLILQFYHFSLDKPAGWVTSWEASGVVIAETGRSERMRRCYVDICDPSDCVGHVAHFSHWFHQKEESEQNSVNYSKSCLHCDGVYRQLQYIFFLCLLSTKKYENVQLWVKSDRSQLLV